MEKRHSDTGDEPVSGWRRLCHDLGFGTTEVDDAPVDEADGLSRRNGGRAPAGYRQGPCIGADVPQAPFGVRSVSAPNVGEYRREVVATLWVEIVGVELGFRGEHDDRRSRVRTKPEPRYDWQAVSSSGRAGLWARGQQRQQFAEPCYPTFGRRMIACEI